MPATVNISEQAVALQFDAVSKRFGKQLVLQELNLSVFEGESFALVGVNGAGKTTCIKAALDFCGIDSGSITIYGQPSTQPIARTRLSFVPERFLPPYYLKGQDFLDFMASLYGTVFAQADVLRTLHAIDLSDECLLKPVRTYSKGMAQKLGLAACFLSNKDLIVLDEPMSGLDPKARLLVKRYLEQRKGAGKTLFFSTHMLADVEDLCDRMSILHNGCVHFIGTPQECREQYAAATLEQAYLNCISA